MKNLAFALSTIGTLLIASPSYADIQVQFLEGAPKDRFVITNIGECDIGTAEFVVDFAASNAGLIFDVTGAGAGVEGFQPFEVSVGAQYLAAHPSISDGDQRATLDIAGLGQNKIIAFTIDVDDTNGTREITISDSEINGTIVSLHMKNNTYSAVLTANAQVVLKTPTCSV